MPPQGGDLLGSPRGSEVSCASNDSVSSLGTAVLGPESRKERKQDRADQRKRRESGGGGVGGGRRTPSATVDFQDQQWQSDSSMSEHSDGEGGGGRSRRERGSKRDGSATPERPQRRQSEAASLARQAELEDKLRTYKRRLTEAKEKNAALRAENKEKIERSAEALRKSQQQVKELQEKAKSPQDTGTTSGATREELAAKKARITELEEGLRGWERIVDTMRRDLDQERKKSKEEKEVLERTVREQLQQTQEKLKKSEGELEFKRKEVQELQDILVASGLDSATGASSQALDEAREALRAAEERCATEAAAKVAAQNEEAAWRQRAEALQRDASASSEDAEAARRRTEEALNQVMGESAERAATIEELERELLRLRQQPQQHADLERLRLELSRAEAEVDRLRAADAELNELRRSGARWRGERDALSRDLAEALAARDAAAETARSAATQQRSAADEVSRLQERARAREREVEAAELQLRREIEEHEATAQDSARQLERLEERLQEYEQQAERGGEATAVLIRERDELRADVRRQQDEWVLERKGLAEEADAARDRCVLLEEEVRSMRTAQQRHAEDAAGLRRSLSDLESARDAATAAAKADRERLARDAAAAAEEGAMARGELGTLRADLAAAREIIAELEARVATADEAAEAARDALSACEQTAQERAQAAELRIVDLTRKCELVAGEREEERRAAVATAEARRAAAEREAERARQDASATDSELRAQLKQKQEALEAAEASARRQETRVAELEQELEYLREDVRTRAAEAAEADSRRKEVEAELRANLRDAEEEAARKGAEAEAAQRQLRESQAAGKRPTQSSSGTVDSDSRIIELEEKLRLLEDLQGQQGPETRSSSDPDGLRKNRLLWEMEGRIVKQRQETLKWQREAAELTEKVRALRLAASEQRSAARDDDDDGIPQGVPGARDLKHTTACLQRRLSKIKDQVVLGDAAPAGPPAAPAARTQQARPSVTQLCQEQQPLPSPVASQGRQPPQSPSAGGGTDSAAAETPPEETPRRSAAALAARSSVRRLFGNLGTPQQGGRVADKYQKYGGAPVSDTAEVQPRRLVRDVRTGPQGSDRADAPQDRGYSGSTGVSRINHADPLRRTESDLRSRTTGGSAAYPGRAPAGHSSTSTRSNSRDRPGGGGPAHVPSWRRGDPDPERPWQRRGRDVGAELLPRPGALARARAERSRSRDGDRYSCGSGGRPRYSTDDEGPGGVLGRRASLSSLGPRYGTDDEGGPRVRRPSLGSMGLPPRGDYAGGTGVRSPAHLRSSSTAW